jgi:hypothetical protein
VRRATCIAVLLGLLATPAGASTTAKVALGDYESAPAIDSGKSYSVGVFTVIKSNGKRQIVRGEQYSGIYYPDAQECDNFDLPLAAESIPISSTGRFRIQEKTPVEDSVVSVDWKGHWSKPGVVAGSITIKHDGCTSKHRWTGGKTG